MKQVQIPSGLRDTFGASAVRKRQTIQEIESVFLKCGYEPIMTPTIEFFQTYMTGYARLQDEEFYKFFDQNGQILALRADMTVPIARFAATKMASRKPPYRFCYTANVYKVNQSFAGKRNEVTDCGIELIGAGPESDLEVLSMAAEVMNRIGGENHTLEIGSSAVFRLACRACGLSMDDMEELAVLTDRKSMVDLESFVEDRIPQGAHAFFSRLPLLAGGEEVLNDAKKLSFHSQLTEEIENLEKLSGEMKLLGCGAHISFDLGKIPHLHYYTGIIFQGYVSGVGNSVLSGGRYDDLLSRFGKDLGACGFGVKVDYLCGEQEDNGKVRTLLYPKGKIVDALRLAAELRKDGPLAVEEADISEMEVLA